MRTILFAACTAVFISCSNSTPAVEEIASEITETLVKVEVVANTSVNLAIEGMVCSKGCAGTIENELGALTGIEGCKVNFDEEIAEVRFDSTQVSPEDIRSFISTIGAGTYSASIL